MSEELRSILVGTAGLSVGAAVAGVLTVARGRVGGSGSELRSALRIGGVALLAQAAHFAEELATGFHRRFPELLGLVPWSTRFFLSFNLFWLAVWTLSLWGLANRRWLALFPLWFLALAGVANGVAHPLLSLRVAGYFPGLVTSPLVGLAGWLLFGRLLRVTESKTAPASLLAR